MSNPATIKKRITDVIQESLQSERHAIIGSDWDMMITQPTLNTLLVKVTAPQGQVRYNFEVNTVQKVTRHA